MAKNYSWDLTINEKDYHIDCQRRGTQFDFRLDGEYLYRLHAEPQQMIEQNVLIGGKRCQVAVYYGDPDVIVDGVMTGVEAKEKKNAKNSKFLCAIGGIFLICVGLFAAFSYIAMTVAGVSVLGGPMSAVFGGVFVVLGIIMLLRAIKKENNFAV